MTDVNSDLRWKLAQIRVENFGTIKSAEIRFSPLTIVIGPQASGKSLLLKLTYFCTDIVNSMHRATEKRQKLDAYKKELVETFRTIFPPGAWGGAKFHISY